jgi:hypothetical protein
LAATKRPLTLPYLGASGPLEAMHAARFQEITRQPGHNVTERLAAEDAVAVREMVVELYGKEYLNPEARQYSSKNKGAQEAHEAIRPAGAEFMHPDKTGLTGREKQLYELIWKRTMATQMKEAEKASVTIKVQAGDGEFTTEVFTELLQAGGDEQLTIGVLVQEFVAEQLESKLVEQVQDAVGSGSGEMPTQAGVDDINCDPDGDRLAMAQSIFRELLQLVGGPVTEVEGTSASHLESVASGGDVVEVKFGAVLDESLHRAGLEAGEVIGILLKPVEESPVADARHLDRLHISGAFVAVREGRQQREVVQYRVGRSEGADEKAPLPADFAA